jgi:hypothetical protein
MQIKFFVNFISLLWDTPDDCLEYDRNMLVFINMW